MAVSEDIIVGGMSRRVAVTKLLFQI